MILECCYKLPERPGVYYFYDKVNILLYIGKSKNIRKRVLSRFYHKSSINSVKNNSMLGDYMICYVAKGIKSNIMH